MNYSKKYKIVAAICIMAVLLCAACSTHSHDEKDGHSHDDVVNENAANEDAPVITTLTEEQIKAVGIEYGNVENKQLTATLKLNGNLNVPNNNKAKATSLYGGVIKTLNIQVGSTVKKGQVIATIAHPQFIQLQEEYLTIGSRIIFAEQELQRQKELNTGNAGALKNYQSAEAELKTLRTRKASLQQQIQLMGINPNTVSNENLKSALVVTSPIHGTISNLFSKIGSYVDVSSPVAEIVDNAQLHLDLQVFEKDLPLIKVGQVIHFTLTNNPANEYDAQVYSIGSAFETDSKTIPVHCKVSGNKSGLIDGMNITAIVSLNNVLMPAVPSDAIVSAEGKDYIFIVIDKKPEEHSKEEEKHTYDATVGEKEKKAEIGIHFEKVEVVKGVSNVGFTAITAVTEIPKDAKIAIKGAFFINAKLSKPEGHSH